MEMDAGGTMSQEGGNGLRRHFGSGDSKAQKDDQWAKAVLVTGIEVTGDRRQGEGNRSGSTSSLVLF